MKTLKQMHQFFILNYKEFFREPEILFWAFIFPISTALLLGIAFSSIPNKTYIVGIKKNKEVYLRILKDISLNPNIKLQVMTEKEIQESLKKRKLYAYIEIEQDIINIYYDKNFKEAKDLYTEILKQLYKNQKTIPLKENNIEVPGTRYIDFLVPGLIAMSIMNSTMWGIGWNFIQMRIKKLLKLFYISPLKQNAFFSGYIFARYTLSILESMILYWITDYFYNIPFNGKWFDLLVFYSISYFSFASISILASSRASSTIAGNGIINLITMPMTLLSGIFFDYTGFPEFWVTLIELLPLTIVANGIRSIFLEGATLLELKYAIFFLFLQGIVLFFIGRKQFLWK